MLTLALLPRPGAFFGALSTVFAGALRFCWPVPRTSQAPEVLQMPAARSC